VLSVRSLLIAARPTARVSHLGSAALTVTLGTVPTAVALLRGESVSVPVIVAALTAGAALGWAAEDPAAELFAPLPIAPPVRTSLRAVTVAVAATGVSLLLALVLVLFGPGLPSDLGARPLEAITAALAALALGLALDRRGDRAAGAAGVAAGLGLPLLVAALAYRWPGVLPSFAVGPVHDRWWVIAAILVLVLVRTGHDPARA
jgi:hypothetical protein